MTSGSPAGRRAADELKRLRDHHPAWKLLASRRAVLVVGCLRVLFGDRAVDVRQEDAVQLLAELFADNANDPDLGLAGIDVYKVARKELRRHVQDGLLTEQGGVLTATDALLQVFRFVEGMSDRFMTSTASRLTTVQQQIAQLEARLSPSAEHRIARVEEQITALQGELERLAEGDFEVLDGAEAAEAVREVFSLSASLRDDFRRVEDSFRQADHELRVSMITDRDHRGAVLDQLMASNEALLETTEGQVFRSFNEQLHRSGQLDVMSAQLAAILDSPAVQGALSRTQQGELRRLRSHLVEESRRVVQARARSERDVRNYLRTGLASEHRRVGQLVNELLGEALNIDWGPQRQRRSPVPLPPACVALVVPSPLRIRVKDVPGDDSDGLDFTSQAADVDDIDPHFWSALDALDRQALAESTLAVLRAAGRPLLLAELAERLPPTHDLETFTVWVQMASEAGCEVEPGRDSVVVQARDLPAAPAAATMTCGGETEEPPRLLFDVPRIRFDYDRLAATSFDL